MTILLLAKPEINKEQLDKDIRALRQAVNMYQNIRKKPPMIITLKGYDLYAIPGTVEKAEAVWDRESKEMMIRLDFKQLFELNSEENQEQEEIEIIDE